MGYASLDQKGIGMHLRQFARAYLIDDAKHRIAFVSVDSCMISDSVKREVINFNLNATVRIICATESFT